MYEFVPAIRTDRYREIKQHKDKGFTFTDEKDYLLIDRVRIERKTGQVYIFEVRVDFHEVRFFIIKNSACIYLTIYELYELLYRMKNENSINVILQLERLMKQKDEHSFSYRGIHYLVRKVPKFSDKHAVRIPDSNTEITYNELFYLLTLIQEKSNYLCSISETRKSFANGILRLFIALLTVEGDHEVLKSIGWEYDAGRHRFSKNKLIKKRDKELGYKEHNKIVKRKYYLTAEELGSII